MNLNERAEMAVQRKNSGKYNCAQAVTTALADQTGLQEEQMKRGTDRGRYDRGPENGRKGDPEGHPPDPGSFQRGLRGHHMQRPEGRDRRKAPLPLRGMRQKCGAHIRQGHGT